MKKIIKIIAAVLAVGVFIFCLLKFTDDTIVNDDVPSDVQPTHAIVIETGNAASESRIVKKSSFGSIVRYLVMEYYQEVTVEYELDGQTVQKDLGSIVVAEKQARYRRHSTKNANTPSGQDLSLYTYDVGDEVTVFVSGNGEVYLPADVRVNYTGYLIAMLVAVVVLIGLLISTVKGILKRRSLQE